MSHRQKGENKSRHRTHAVKPASLVQAVLAPLAPVVAVVPDTIPAKAARKSRQIRAADGAPIQ